MKRVVQVCLVTTLMRLSDVLKRTCVCLQGHFQKALTCGVVTDRVRERSTQMWAGHHSVSGSLCRRVLEEDGGRKIRCALLREQCVGVVIVH